MDDEYTVSFDAGEEMRAEVPPKPRRREFSMYGVREVIRSLTHLALFVSVATITYLLLQFAWNGGIRW